MKHPASLVHRRARVQVLGEAAACITRLHAAGYAHRDLKPSNVMWLPRETRWTLIDFGCTARVGDAAPAGFTLTYAAPEVVRAWLDGAPAALVSPAIDSWALGIMAVQLLSGDSVFAPGTSAAVVRSLPRRDCHFQRVCRRRHIISFRPLGAESSAAVPVLQQHVVRQKL